MKKKVLKPAKKKVIKKTITKKKVVKKAVKKKSSKISTQVSIKPARKIVKKKLTQKKTLKKTKSAQASIPYDFDSQDHYNYPTHYNKTHIVLLARDPYWLYAYWEFTHDDLMKAKSQLGHQGDRANVVLRIFDVTYKDFDGFNANHWFDVDVGYDVKSWYIQLGSDNTSYCAELGLRTEEGGFHKLVRSNFVTTPRAYMSGREDLMWMDVEHKQQPYVNVVFKSHHSRIFKLPKQKVFLTEAELREYYAKHFAFLKQVLAKRLMLGLQKNSKQNMDFEIEQIEICYDEELFKDMPDGCIETIAAGASEVRLIAKRIKRQKIKRLVNHGAPLLKGFSPVAQGSSDHVTSFSGA